MDWIKNRRIGQLEARIGIFRLSLKHRFFDIFRIGAKNSDVSIHTTCIDLSKDYLIVQGELELLWELN